MTPTRSQVQGWQTDFLTTLAQQWRTRAKAWECAYRAYQKSVASPDGTTWTGALASAAKVRADADQATVADAAAVLTQLASIAENGAADLQELRRTVLETIAAAADAGFVVNDDLSVTDTRPVDEETAALRHQQAEAIAQDLQRKAEALLVGDQDVASDLESAKAELVALIGPENLGTSPFQTGPNGEVLIKGTDGDDTVRVSQDPDTGDVVVDVNGATKSYDPIKARDMIIDTGDGNDTVEIAPGIVSPVDPFGFKQPEYIGFRINAGAGNDLVRGGSGRDYINGGAGDDVIHGGDGDDVIYGGDGNDRIHGDGGNNYIDGGKGDDILYGGMGNDMLHGGQGNDIINGGPGRNVIITGAGADTVNNSGGQDVVKGQAGKDVVNPATSGGSTEFIETTIAQTPDNIVIDSTDPAFRERVEADLDLYNSTDAGKAMLSELGKVPYQIEIRDLTEPNSYSYPPGTAPGAGPTDQVIYYNPAFVDTYPYFDPATGQRIGEVEFTPGTTLIHEMAHSYDFTNDTLRDGTYHGQDAIDTHDHVPNAERVAAGLPIDDDNNPRTPERLAPEHPFLLTENGIRTELGIPEREHYGFAIPRRRGA